MAQNDSACELQEEDDEAFLLQAAEDADGTLLLQAAEKTDSNLQSVDQEKKASFTSEMSIVTDELRDEKEEVALAFERLKKAKSLFIRVPRETSVSASPKKPIEIFVPVYTAEIATVRADEPQKRGQEIQRRTAFAFASRNLVKFVTDGHHICLPFDLISMLFSALFLWTDLAGNAEKFDYRSTTDHSGMMVRCEPHPKRKTTVKVLFCTGRIDDKKPVVYENAIMLQFSSLSELRKRLYSVSMTNQEVQTEKIRITALPFGRVYPALLCCPLESLNINRDIAQDKAANKTASLDAATGQLRVIHKEAFLAVPDKWEVRHFEDDGNDFNDDDN